MQIKIEKIVKFQRKRKR